MYRHSRDLEFEQAAALRDRIRELRRAGLAPPPPMDTASG